jgi:2'-5' RNA ligase
LSGIRFVILTIPPPPLCARLEAAHAMASALTGSVAALAFPPHVTLRTGAMVPSQNIAEFAAGIRAAMGPWQPFPLRSQSLFAAPYESDDGNIRHMVAWRFALDPPLLELHRRLLSYARFRRRPQPHFEPHLTLAFDDLIEEAARLLLERAKGLPDVFPPTLSWECDNVGLYRLNGDRWEPYYQFHFQGAVA